MGVLDGLRRKDFDVDAAYLQGNYVDRKVYARAPKYFRTYDDERGVEMVAPRDHGPSCPLPRIQPPRPRARAAPEPGTICCCAGA